MSSRMRTAFSFGANRWDVTHRFETSWLLSPWALFACRALISLYIFTTLFFIIGYTCANESLGGCADVRRSFSFFTVLTYWGLGFYFLVSAVHTGSYALTGRTLLNHHSINTLLTTTNGGGGGGDSHGLPVSPLRRVLQALHSLLYTTVVTLPFLVTIVYWAVLYRAPWFALPFDAWHNVSQHALNSVFAAFEVVVARTEPMPCVHLLWLILILLGYLAVAYITVATQGWYTYSFLNYRAVHGRGYVAAYIFGIAVGVVMVFLVVYGLIWLRRWLTEEKLGMRGKLAAANTTTTATTATPTPHQQHDLEANAESNKAVR
ncbi:hypothetical protein AAL_07278 [Moelleriella libera RCEF 2490]|uniref:FAR-17a/AIG1-like protein n=1 Tax=Moelleriella libera RCEF 2490 TaxID=1081109 RepID=A0A167XK12_9HYPO|nr:hypothetical protein AAL_07278 [Moelleriella libera RCEF 2490]